MAPPSPDTVSHAPNDPVVTVSAGLPSVAGYDVQELVGRGGMGKVYRAKHLALGRTIALKVMTHEQDERLTARFRDEARAVAKLQHPNIAQLFDTGTADGRPYYSMEFADGGTLAGKWDGKPQDPAATAATMESVARAIQHSHEHGILHRDLKPGNVLMAADSTPKVADFGLAKELPSAVAGNATLPAAAGLTRTGEVVGTPAYMPPEQASGVTNSLTAAADVYSLGAMLYEGLTGRPPFQAPDALQTLFLVLSTEPVPPKILQPKLPADLNTICLKCLEKQPKKRYTTAGELADDLRRFLNGEPIIARPVGRVERAVKWARRHKAGAALMAVSTVLVVAVVVFAVVVAVNAVRLGEANGQLAKKNDELEETNHRLTEAKVESDKAYALATSTLDETVRDLSLKLIGMPNAEALMLEVIARTSDLYHQLGEVRPTDGGAKSRYLMALAMRAAFESSYGKHEAAARTRQQMTDSLKRELTALPNDPDLRAFEAGLAFNTASAANGAGDAEKASAARAEFEKLAEDFVARFPTHREAGKFRVQRHWMRAFDEGAKGDQLARADRLREAVADARGMSEPVARFTFLSSSLSQLGMVLMMARKPDDADVVFAEAEAVYTEGIATLPQSAVASRGGRAEARTNRAQIALESGREADARRLYAEVEPDLRQLVKEFPLSLENRLSLAACVYWQGVLLVKSDPAAALWRIEEAIALLDEELARRTDVGVQGVRDAYAKNRDILAKKIREKK